MDPMGVKLWGMFNPKDVNPTNLMGRFGEKTSGFTETVTTLGFNKFPGEDTI